MHDQPLVSIVTPSYNQARFLGQAVESVLVQDYPQIEYLVLDGGSTDGSVEILRAHEDRIDHWVSEPDAGQADAINRGWQRSRGQILAWLNSDDRYEPGAISAVVEAFQRHPGADVVAGDCQVIDGHGAFLLLNANPGYAMYSAQHPLHGTSFQEFTAVPVPEELRGLNEAQLDRQLLRRGIGFVLAEPGRYLLLSLSRVGDYFEFWPTPGTTLLHNLGRTGSFGLFLPFMVGGLWLALRAAGLDRSRASWLRFSSTPLALALLFMALYSLLHVLTWAMPRYRLPVDAVALPFAALALLALARRVSRRLVPRCQA